MTAWAEVIGQPIAHSLSPTIHRFWLAAVGIDATYEATAVGTAELPAFLAARRSVAGWRGSNVTAPHKQAVLQLLDRLDEAAVAIGAVNCVYPRDSQLIGTNTDFDGIGEALSHLPIQGETVAVIGAGGAARAAIRWLDEQGAEAVAVVVRRPQAAEAMSRGVKVFAFNEAWEAFSSASLVINATPLGLARAEAMPAPLLDAVRGARVRAAFDMVYRPLDTPFLQAAREGGAQTVDGLTMLIGQARRSFALFFGSAPPADKDLELRALIGDDAG